MLKTSKTVLKRLKISKKGKIQRRPVKQSHKAKLSGRKNQEKRRLFDFSKVDEKKIKRYIPYHYR